MRFPLPDRVMLWSAVSGVLLALSFPRPGISSLAWVALVPLFLVMDKRPFRSGFVAGMFFFGTVLYWLNIVMTTYGKLAPVFSLVAYLLLVAYLALFFATATWGAWRLREKCGLSPVLTLPVLWVALEFVRSFLLTGFPWATLGYSQSHLSLIQSADLLGVYGLSFLLVLSNAVLAGTIATWQRGDRRQIPRVGWVALVVLFSLNLGYGYVRLRTFQTEDGKPLVVGLIQGNIDQSLKWDPSYQEETVRIYTSLSEKASRKDGVELLLWPESATPFYFQEDGPLAESVKTLTVDTGAYLLFGSPAYQVVNKSFRYLNSAFLLSPQGQVVGRSDKVHLVPFGEYVPLGKYLPFVEKMVVGVGDFSPGVISPLPMNGARIGALICFEGIFPELARQYVRQGSDLLVNITNDAWFGRSAAPYQHLAMTRFRAIENRVWVARAANTGISAFIRPDGTIVRQTPIFERGYLDGEVRLGAHPGVYTRIGDLFPLLALIVSIIWLVKTRKRMDSAGSEG